jgi:acyl carrier protein
MEGDTEKGGAEDVEQRVLTLCAQALSLDAVGLHDNFFELGGDSLSAMWLLSSIQEEFQVELPLAELFDAKTMAEVNAVVVRQVALASHDGDGAAHDAGSAVS